MTSWTQKAKAHFSQERQNGTAETAESLCVFSQERQNGTAETAESLCVFSQERQNGTAETAESLCVFLQERQNGTAETAETPLLAVLAVQSGAFRKKHDVSNQGEAAANDPVQSVGQRQPYDGMNAKFQAASKSLDDSILKHGGALDLPPMPEKLIPKNGGLFTARLTKFTDKGVTLVDAQTLANRLMTRDSELDDRRMCLECRHLNGYGSWQCASWCKAKVAHRPRDNGLPTELVTRLQRCDGFLDAAS